MADWTRVFSHFSAAMETIWTSNRYLTELNKAKAFGDESARESVSVEVRPEGEEIAGQLEKENLILSEGDVTPEGYAYSIL